MPDCRADRDFDTELRDHRGRNRKGRETRMGMGHGRRACMGMELRTWLYMAVHVVYITATKRSSGCTCGLTAANQPLTWLYKYARVRTPSLLEHISLTFLTS